MPASARLPRLHIGRKPKLLRVFQRERGTMWKKRQRYAVHKDRRTTPRAVNARREIADVLVEA